MAMFSSRLLQSSSSRFSSARLRNLLPPVPIYHRLSLSLPVYEVNLQRKETLIQKLRSQIARARKEAQHAEKLLLDMRGGRSGLQIHMASHPFCRHLISILTNAESSPISIGDALAELGRILMYEATRDFSVTAYWKIQAAKDVVAVITLHGSRLLAEYASTILPTSQIYDIGLIGDVETLPITTYLMNKLPPISEETQVFLVDYIFVAGGAAMSVLSFLRDRGVKSANIKVICVGFSAPSYKVFEEFPGLCVYAGVATHPTLFADDGTLPTSDDDDGTLLTVDDDDGVLP